MSNDEDCLHQAITNCLEFVSPDRLRYVNTYEEEGGLWTGRFATLKICVQRSSLKRVAVKVFHKRDQNHRDRARMKREIKIVESLKSPTGNSKVVNFVEQFAAGIHHYLVMDYIPGEHLFDQVSTREFYSEKNAADLMSDILAAIQYCHEKGVVHRDVRPGNLLLHTKGRMSQVKLIDFGLAVNVDDLKSEPEAVSWIGYGAPEMLRNKAYGAKVDEWACGVILYNLLTGTSPFSETANQSQFERIAIAGYDQEPLDQNEISHEARRLISALLKADPAERIDARNAARFSFIKARSGPPTHLSKAVHFMKSFTFGQRRSGEIKRVQLHGSRSQRVMPSPIPPAGYSATNPISESCAYEDLLGGFADCRVVRHEDTGRTPGAISSDMISEPSAQTSTTVLVHRSPDSSEAEKQDDPTSTKTCSIINPHKEYEEDLLMPKNLVFSENAASCYLDLQGSLPHVADEDPHDGGSVKIFPAEKNITHESSRKDSIPMNTDS